MRIKRRKRKKNNDKVGLGQRAEKIKNQNRNEIRKMIGGIEAGAKIKIGRIVTEIVLERNKRVRKRVRTEIEVAKKEKTKERKEDENPT